jgi:hypothetical protein
MIWLTGSGSLRPIAARLHIVGLTVGLAKHHDHAKALSSEFLLAAGVYAALLGLYLL